MRRLPAATFFALVCIRAFAQADVAFEAGSIKPFPEGSPVMMSGCMGGPGSGDPSRINCEYTTVRMLVMRAYKVKSQEIFGPEWLDSAHFNIVATLPPGAAGDQVPLMFRNLLAARFKLALHHEDRALPIYELTIAKGGLKIKEAPPPGAAVADDSARPAGPPPIGEDGFPILSPSVIAAGPIILYRQGRARLQAGKATLAALAESLSRQLDRVVVDETGLPGKYAITLNWTPDAAESGGRPRQPGNSDLEASTPGLDLFAAVEQQLGLKLVSKKVARDALVIDRVERVPTEN